MRRERRQLTRAELRAITTPGLVVRRIPPPPPPANASSGARREAPPFFEGGFINLCEYNSETKDGENVE
jgi:hypothetical protein